jgi:hypothetical protein
MWQYEVRAFGSAARRPGLQFALHEGVSAFREPIGYLREPLAESDHVVPLRFLLPSVILVLPTALGSDGEFRDGRREAGCSQTCERAFGGPQSLSPDLRDAQSLNFVVDSKSRGGAVVSIGQSYAFGPFAVVSRHRIEIRQTPVKDRFLSLDSLSYFPT